MKGPQQPDRKRQIWRHHFDKAFEQVCASFDNVTDATIATARERATKHADEMMLIEDYRFAQKEGPDV